MMKNINLFNSMIDRYHSMSAAHSYIWGFTFAGNVYMVTTSETLVERVCTLDRASRGQGYSLRFKPTKEQKLYLMAQGATILCSETYFNDVYASCKYNRGEVFEKMVTEYFGQTWEKDRVPFTEGGDVEVKGIAYQVKFQKATFCNEKSLANLSK